MIAMDSLYSGNWISEISYSTDVETYFINGDSGSWLVGVKLYKLLWNQKQHELPDGLDAFGGRNTSWWEKRSIHLLRIKINSRIALVYNKLYHYILL